MGSNYRKNGNYWKNKVPGTFRLVERRLETGRPGTVKRIDEEGERRTTWVPTTSNKRSKEEIAELVGELINHANRNGGDYQPTAGPKVNTVEETEQPEEIEKVREKANH